MSQCEKILRHLNDYGSINPVSALGEYGVMRLASRIADLRRLGHPIRSELQYGVNRYGEPTRWAEYYISREDADA